MTKFPLRVCPLLLALLIPLSHCLPPLISSSNRIRDSFHRIVANDSVLTTAIITGTTDSLTHTPSNLIGPKYAISDFSTFQLLELSLALDSPFSALPSTIIAARLGTSSPHGFTAFFNSQSSSVGLRLYYDPYNRG